jgi:serine/threonine protein kinase
VDIKSAACEFVQIDARSDIFSFGSVLYEMVTGGRAFEGDSPISTLAAVVHDHPQPAVEVAPGAAAELIASLSAVCASSLRTFCGT